MPLVPGQRIGRIRVDSLLGAGGMSEVYRGFDELLERPVALKVVSGRRRLDALARARFMREARILSRLDHPDICRVYDLIEAGDADVMVLELVEGTTLRDAMEKDLTDEDRLGIAERVAGALAAAHARGIVHRDLKPRNVMCTPSGGIKVLDFDLARPAHTTSAAAVVRPPETRVPPVSEGANGDDDVETLPGTLEDGTTVGSIVGTVAYMSPEQARGDDLTVASDLYSLGIILHELFTGSSPYPGDRPLRARLLQVSQGETRPVRGLGAELTEIIEGLKSPDPERRPPAEEVTRRLRALRERPRRRRLLRVGAMLAVGLAAAIMTGLWLAGWLNSQTTTVASGERPLLALLPFDNATGQAAHDWVERGLMEMVGQALAAAGAVELAPSDDVVRSLVTRGLAVDLDPGPEEARVLLQGLDAELVTATRLSLHGEGYRLTATLFGPAGSLGHWEAQGSSPVEAGSQLVDRLHRLLVGRPFAPSPAGPFSQDPYASLLYGLGLDRLARGRSDSARRHLELCLERDGELLWALAMHAVCLHRVGEHDGAEAEALQVLERARGTGQPRLEELARSLLVRPGG